MPKKKVFVISHSHWDREWYMGYEQHHMRLVELMDDLLEIFRTQPRFNSFHLDGQTIILDDYLEVRPEKEKEVRKYIENGKLRIGPFYILQDDFLISSEANTRNALIGYEESKRWGSPVNLGYFPDTFGNMGQTPQMMKLFNLDYVAFGRGVKPTGLNNQTFEGESYSSQYSEMWWNGPDKSKILAVLFANWYSNGNEIPVDRMVAKKFWDQKLADAEKYASTDNILMMNGVDHEPVQKNVIDALDVAQELYPNYEFIHSNFDEYLKVLAKDISQNDNIGSITGEITSQETDGWYTLANTASTRTYLKQKNTQVQRQLENITEPLAIMTYGESNKYPQDQLNYAWKLLLQNHPHDSICGCSVDEISHEMMTRFRKSMGVGRYLSEQALEDFTNQIDSSQFDENSKIFTIVNTQGNSKTQLIEVEVEIDRAPYSEGKPEKQYQKMQDRLNELKEFEVTASNGKKIEFELTHKDVRFSYDLPKDSFRIPYVGLYVTVKIPIINMPAFSWETFAIKEVEKTDIVKKIAKKMYDESTRTAENEWLKVKINIDGTLDILDKKTNKLFANQLVFEDTGDIGNEYIYRQSADGLTINSRNGKSSYSILKNNDQEVIVNIETVMEIPQSADARLKYEQEAVIDITQRIANRSTKIRQEKIITTFCMNRYEDQIKFTTKYDNHCKDHRLRVLFPTNIETHENHSESIFEVVTRPNDTSENWKNPTNPQHQQSFVNVSNTKGGVTIGNFGLNEYEILSQDNTIALTLLRSVGEMGDWGYFPTPEAQCLGNNTYDYSIAFHDSSLKSRNETYKQARVNQVSLQAKQLAIHHGDRKAKGNLLTIDGTSSFAVTSLKKAEREAAVILRGFNLTDSVEDIDIKISKKEVTPVNLIEKDISIENTKKLNPFEIRSYKFK